MIFNLEIYLVLVDIDYPITITLCSVKIKHYKVLIASVSSDCLGKCYIIQNSDFWR